LDPIARKKLTADNLQKRGRPHQEHYTLCNGPLETVLHLCLLCPFAKIVWNQVLSWEHFNDLHLQPLSDPPHISTWWEEAARRVPRAERRRFNGVVIYTFWNLWKERNRRIFNNITESTFLVAVRIKDDIEQRKRAFASGG
jgi:hypothetical protein